MTNNLRFGVGVRSVKSRTELQETARRYEDLGFDVLPPGGARAISGALCGRAGDDDTAARDVRAQCRVLQAGSVGARRRRPRPAQRRPLRPGVGGAGYVEAEFEAAELPFPSAGKRVDHLEHVTRYLRERHSSIPILIAGNGDRVLTIAAKHAQIIGLTGSGKPVDDPLAERIDFVRAAAAGDRFSDLELNIAITAAPADDGSGMPDLKLTRRFTSQLSDEQLLALPSVLSGTPRDGADKLRHLQEKYGLTYFTVQDNHTDYLAKVIAELR